MKKLLAVAIIFLFIGVSNIPSTGISAESHCLINSSIGYFNSIMESEERGVNVTLNGTMGENGWYISCVYIQISFGPDVQSFYYQFNGGSWQGYTEPFGPIREDGEYTFCWFYVDNEGNQSDVECIDFKIDQTLPTIDLTAEKIGDNTWLLTADVSDETSGVNRVEFYVDEELIGTVTEAPYEWTYSGDGNMAQAIAYDNAGNYATSEKIDVDTSGPEIVIASITGGIGVRAVIENIGDADATNVNWSIMFDGGLIFIGGDNTGRIINIPPGENVTIHSGLICGFGRTKITISAECAEGSSDTKTYRAFICGFWIYIVRMTIK